MGPKNLSYIKCIFDPSGMPYTELSFMFGANVIFLYLSISVMSLEESD